MCRFYSYLLYRLFCLSSGYIIDRIEINVLILVYLGLILSFKGRFYIIGCIICLEKIMCFRYFYIKDALFVWKKLSKYFLFGYYFNYKDICRYRMYYVFR